MTTEQAKPEAVVTIRTALRDWVWQFVLGGVWLGIAALSLGVQSSLAWLQAAVACVMFASGFLIRSYGVDLTPGSAMVRGARRRSIPWAHVQAVVHHRRMGTWFVRLILESGRPLTLRAPTTWRGLGGAEYERDFHRIGQWWLDHRGESWRPLRSEAPQLSVRG